MVISIKNLKREAPYKSFINIISLNIKLCCKLSKEIFVDSVIKLNISDASNRMYSFGNVKHEKSRSFVEDVISRDHSDPIMNPSLLLTCWEVHIMCQK